MFSSTYHLEVVIQLLLILLRNHDLFIPFYCFRLV